VVFIGVVATFTLLVLLVVSVWSADHRGEENRGRAEIQKRLDAIRAAGEPITIQDLAKLYPDPPPEHDASNLLASAFAALSIPDSVNDLPYFGRTDYSVRDKPLDEAMKARVQAFLKQNQAALDAVPDGITNAWASSGFSHGTVGTGLKLHDLEQLAKLLCLSAVYQAELGHGAEATRQLRQSLAVIRILPSSTFLNYSVRRAGEQRGFYALERVLNHTELSDADLLMLENLFADSRPESFRETRMTLRCIDIWSMEAVLATVGDGFLPPDALPGGRTIPLKRGLTRIIVSMSGRLYKYSDYTNILDLRTRQIAALDLPMERRFGEWKRVGRSFAIDRKHATLAQRLTVPAYDVLPLDDAIRLTELQMARTALAIERWRLSHGKQLPESLTDVVPEMILTVPMDPFDNGPLRYQKLAHGYLIYSIGPDFKDDGGKEKPASTDDFTGYDITFRVGH
jgi:hypothetical protein